MPFSQSASAPGARRLMRQIRAIMAEPGDAQARLDGFVREIASNLVADVCSVYLVRSGGQLELCASLGLAPAAVHATRMRPGEGLVGLVARTARPVTTADAANHPAFSYHPETGEDRLNSFAGVPILRGGRLLGVLTLQNEAARAYDEEETEILQTAAMVLAEVVADPAFSGSDALKNIELRPSRPERVIGRRVADGVAIGVAVKHEPHVPSADLIADDPDAEAERVGAAVAALRAHLDALLEGRGAALGGQPQEVLETFRMIAHDQGWLDQLQEAARSGLTAEAAVERVRNEHRARLLNAREAYLRDRLHDLEDLANRLLRLLAGETSGPAGRRLPDAAVLIARDVSAAELLEFEPGSLAGLVLEEGSASSHAAIVARAIGLPVIGRLEGVLDRVEDGDTVVVDATQGEVHLRPSADVLESVRSKIALRGKAQAELARLTDVAAVTTDGEALSLQINAGLLVDLPQLSAVGADGVGLFRTEFQFMIGDSMPRLADQTALYRAALEAAGDKPVTFRTLDLGGDKILPYAAQEREANPAMGWRALRLALDRPGLMRYQLRALMAAAAGRRLRIMFPLVATVEEFTAARAIVEREQARAVKRGAGPDSLVVGAMVETPALLFQLDALMEEADFVSIGANDLMQFLFAADRTNPRLGDRYDVLSRPMLRAVRSVVEAGERHGTAVSVCGEASGRPLEALALIALGCRTLSMPPAGVGRVKRMALSLDAGDARETVNRLLSENTGELRPALEAYADARHIPI